MTALLRAREAVMRQLRPALRQHGLTEQQWRVLSQLLAANEIAASELAAATCLRASSLSRIIKDLEQRGYIGRRAQLEDLRRTMVSITDRGRRTMQAIEPATAEVYASIAERFGDERIDLMIQLSVDLVTSLVGNAALVPEENGDD
nr:homoprotocatechuate degradation operon regulator HpaR [Chthonobacter rhizosphaerae]